MSTLTVHDLPTVDRPTVAGLLDQMVVLQSQLLTAPTRNRRQHHHLAEAENLLQRAITELREAARS